MIERYEYDKPIELPKDLYKEKDRVAFKNYVDSLSPEGRLKHLRWMLTMIHQLDPDCVDGVFGVSIAERAEDRPENEDCFKYIYGYNSDVREETFTKLRKNYQETGFWIPGAKAIYFGENDIPLHIGRATAKKTVISKWGEHGHVFEHDPLMVPVQFGDRIALYVPKSSDVGV